MRKSKVLKALLVFGMSIATATSVVGMTACNSGHEHTYGDWQKDKDGHYKIATCCEDVKTEKEKHTDENKDNKCDVCGYTIQEASTPGGDTEKPGGTQTPGGDTETPGGGDTEKPGGSETPGGGEEDPTPPVVKDDVTVNVSDLTTVTTKVTLPDGTALGDNTGLTLVGAVEVDANNKKAHFKGEDVSVTKRLKLAQKFEQTEANASKSMGIKVRLEANATIVVYAYSGSADKTDRELGLYDADKNLVQNSSQNVGDGNNNILAAIMFNVEANKDYYIGASNAAGVNIYYIGIIYGELGETRESVAAVDETCTTAGNKAHYYTNYGRYFESETATTPVTGSSTIIKAKGHSYSLVPDSIVNPTADNAGSAKLTCANEAGVEVEVPLPKLTTEGAYNRVENAEDSTKYDYSYKTSQGVTVTFTDTKVEEVKVEITGYLCDFTDTTKFAAATIATTANADIMFKDGTSTGLTALGDSSNKKIEIKSVGDGAAAVQALAFNGGVGNTKSGVKFTVKNAGVVTIKVRYCNANAGRYIKIIDGSGKSLATTDAAVDGKVVTGGVTTASVADIKEATVTLTVEANSVLILGSASSGLYVTYLEVTLPTATV